MLIRAHGGDLGPIIAPLHDFHHSVVISLVPMAQRKAFWKITEMVKELGNPEYADILSTLHDMEFIRYQFLGSPFWGGKSKEECFAETILGILKNNTGEIEPNHRLLLGLIKTEIHEHATTWKAQYGLDPVKLLELLSKK